MYNKTVLHYRKRLRKPIEWYPESGYYFITICCKEIKHFFGKVIDNQMYPNSYGQVAISEWENIFIKYPSVENVIFQVMPNHLHAIIYLKGKFDFMNELNPDPDYHVPEISKVIGLYKSHVANECLKLHLAKYEHQKVIPKLGKIWLRSVWERVIRDQRAFNNIYKYIENNPTKWTKDKFQQTSEASGQTCPVPK